MIVTVGAAGCDVFRPYETCDNANEGQLCSKGYTCVLEADCSVPGRSARCGPSGMSSLKISTRTFSSKVR